MIVPAYRPLILSGNEISDVVRAKGLAGDGRSLDGSTGIARSVQNLVSNGGFETNTTGWTTGGTNSIARSTEQAKFGAASLKCIYSNNAAMASFGALVLTAAAHSGSIWVYIPIAFTGTDIAFTFSGYVGISGTATAQAVMALREQWQEIVVPNVTPAGGDLSGSMLVTVAGTPTGADAAKTIYIDGLQVNLGPNSPYVETDGGAATRSAGRIRLVAESLLHPRQGWFVGKYRTHWGNAIEPSTGPALFAFGDDANNHISMQYENGLDRWKVFRYASGGTPDAAITQAMTRGGLPLTAMRWTPAGVEAGADGSWGGMTATTAVPTLTTKTLDIGSFLGTTQHLDADCLWCAMGVGLLSNADFTALNALGSAKPDFGCFSRAARPTAIWDGISRLVAVNPQEVAYP